MIALGAELGANLHRLAWAQRCTYVALFGIGILDLFTATRRYVDPPWRMSYAVKGLVCIVTWSYYSLLLFGVLDATQFVNVVRWLQPLIILAMGISAMLHLIQRQELWRRRRAEDHAQAIIDKEPADPPARP